MSVLRCLQKVASNASLRFQWTQAVFGLVNACLRRLGASEVPQHHPEAEPSTRLKNALTRVVTVCLQTLTVSIEGALLEGGYRGIPTAYFRLLLPSFYDLLFKGRPMIQQSEDQEPDQDLDFPWTSWGACQQATLQYLHRLICQAGKQPQHSGPFFSELLTWHVVDDLVQAVASVGKQVSASPTSSSNSNSKIDSAQPVPLAILCLADLLQPTGGPVLQLPFGGPDRERESTGAVRSNPAMRCGYPLFTDVFFCAVDRSWFVSGSRFSS